MRSQCVSLQNALEIKWGSQLLSMKCCVIEGRKFSILPKRETGQCTHSLHANFREVFPVLLRTLLSVNSTVRVSSKITNLGGEDMGAHKRAAKCLATPTFVLTQ